MIGRRLVALGLIAMFVPLPAWALDVGDDAPALKVKKWIKGDKFKLEDVKDKEIVVLMFFTTTCYPCRVTLPKVNEIQAKFEKDGVRTIGLTPEDSSTVMNFVHSMGARVGVSVAIDTDGLTYKSFFEEEGDMEKLPRMVIIDRKGKIAWHGHPADDDFGEELELLVLKQPAPEDKKLKKANSLREKYLELAKKSEIADDEKEEMKKIGEQMIKLGADYKDFLVDVTNMIVKNKSIKNRDLAIAKKSIETAYELTEGKDCRIIELRARVEYKAGNTRGALKYLREALNVCEEFDHEDKLQNLVKKLKKKMEKSG